MQQLLLRLPREIRDEIYTHLFQAGSTIIASFPPHPASPTPISSINNSEQATKLQLKLRRCPPKPLPGADIATFEHPCDSPTWLLTCKQIFHEGREAFIRTPDLEWLFDAKDLAIAQDVDFAWTTSLMTPSAQPINLRINLAPEHFKTFFKNHYRDLQPYGDLKYFVQFLIANNIRLQRLRICTRARGDDHKFRERRLGQVHRQFMLYLLDTFKNLDVETWQFGFGEKSYGQRRGDLYEWKGSRDREGRAVRFFSDGPTGFLEG